MNHVKLITFDFLEYFMDIRFLKEFENKLGKYVELLSENDDYEIIEFLSGRIKLHLKTAQHIISESCGSNDYKVLDFIKKNGKVKKSDISYNLQCVGNAQYIDNILNQLIIDGKIKSEKIGKKRIYCIFNES